MLGLRPNDFYELTPGELDKMVKSKNKVRTVELMASSYFVTQIINNCRQVKEPVRFEQIAKPFLPEKTSEEIKAERETFFKDFGKQRKEVEENGNNS